MGILRDSGSTNFNLPSLGKTGPPHDALLEAVRDEARGEYEVFGEITRGKDGSVVYLARDVEDARLVVLKLTSSGTGDYFLEVIKELDASVAAPEGVCPSCQSPLRQWGRYCTRCGSDLWGDPSISGEWSRQELLQAVKEMAADRYEIYGEIPRAEGAGFVYFGRDLSTGKVTALRLLKDSADAFSLGQTGLLRRIVKSDQQEAEPREPRPQPLPAEPLPPEPLLPEVLGAAPQHSAPRPPPPSITPPPSPVYQDIWTQAIDFLKQPIVIGIVAITLVVATVTLCTIVLTDDPAGPAPAEPVTETAPPPVAAPPAALQEEVLAYSVVIGSYGTLEEATERQRQLSGIGPILYTAPTVVRGSVYYRLFAAMLPDRDQAQAFQSRLVSEGVKSAAREWDVRPTALAFFIGTYAARRDADATVERLLREGIPAYRVPAAAAGVSSGFHVYAGGYENAAEAAHLQELMARAGLDTELVERVGLPVP